MAASTAPDSPTLLLNKGTGEAVAHWLELDHSRCVCLLSKHAHRPMRTVSTPPGPRSDGWENGHDYARTLIMTPAARLEDGATYIVAMRNLTTASSGAPVPPSAAFKALRDGSPSTDPAVTNRRAEYAALFKAVDAAPGWGGSQATMQLAWEFTVGSTQQWTGKFVSMRDDAFARLPAGGPAHKIYSIRENPDDVTFRHIEGAVQVPWYLNQKGPGMDVRLVLDPTTGMPQFTEMVWVNFTAIIPLGVVNSSTFEAARVVQYGHGLFGSREEVEDHYLQVEGGKNKYVYIATDWIGLSGDDVVVRCAAPCPLPCPALTACTPFNHHRALR